MIYLITKANTKRRCNDIISGLQTSSNNIVGVKKEFFKQIYFLICESCFWCATYLSSKSILIAKCPNCYNKIQWIPIPNANFSKLDNFHGNPYTIPSQLGDRNQK
jgi:hypothetical protein